MHHHSATNRRLMADLICFYGSGLFAGLESKLLLIVCICHFKDNLFIDLGRVFMNIIMSSSKFFGRKDRIKFQFIAFTGHFFTYIFAAFNFDNVTFEGLAMQENKYIF
jgi:hypothetical protein